MSCHLTVQNHIVKSIKKARAGFIQIQRITVTPHDTICERSSQLGQQPDVGYQPRTRKQEYLLDIKYLWVGSCSFLEIKKKSYMTKTSFIVTFSNSLPKMVPCLKTVRPLILEEKVTGDIIPSLRTYGSQTSSLVYLSLAWPGIIHISSVSIA